jgi:hypothetical protein
MKHSCTVRAQCARMPERSGRGGFSKPFAIRKKLVDVTGFEPATPCLQSRATIAVPLSTRFDNLLQNLIFMLASTLLVSH